MSGIWLILPAAGSGSRFGGERPKQLQTIAGAPILVHSLRAFAGLIDGCVVPTRPDLRPLIAPLVADHGPAGSLVVNGGPTRQASVAAAIAALPPTAERILVHDAARPCIHRDDILACLQALDEHPCVFLARPCRDTVKRIADGLVCETVARDDLWLAETPQCFLAGPGRAAFATASAPHTDDVALLAEHGIAGRPVPARHPNPKLTGPDDLPIVEALLGRHHDG